MLIFLFVSFQVKREREREREEEKTNVFHSAFEKANFIWFQSVFRWIKNEVLYSLLPANQFLLLVNCRARARIEAILVDSFVIFHLLSLSLSVLARKKSQQHVSDELCCANNTIRTQPILELFAFRLTRRLAILFVCWLWYSTLAFSSSAPFYFDYEYYTNILFYYAFQIVSFLIVFCIEKHFWFSFSLSLTCPPYLVRELLHCNKHFLRLVHETKKKKVHKKTITTYQAFKRCGKMVHDEFAMVTMRAGQKSAGHII